MPISVAVYATLICLPALVSVLLARETRGAVLSCEGPQQAPPAAGMPLATAAR